MKITVLIIGLISFLTVLVNFMVPVDAFTITTNVEKTQLTFNTVKLSESSSLRIDASAFAASSPWHNGIYIFIPYYYKPVIAGVNSTGRPAISFKVRFLDNRSVLHALDCKAGWGYASFHSAGETQRCDGGPDRMQGRIEYRINKIIGPAYTENVNGNSVSYSLKTGQTNRVIINFDVRFRIDGKTGSGGTFTAWISTQAQLNAVAAGLPATHSQAATSNASSLVIPKYYIYFSKEDIDTLANYLPLQDQNLSALPFEMRESIIYQVLPKYFTVSEQGTGTVIRCVPSKAFAGTVVGDETLNYVLMCSNVKRKTQYIARFMLYIQNQVIPFDLCWYVDSGGDLHAC